MQFSNLVLHTSKRIFRSYRGISINDFVMLRRSKFIYPRNAKSANIINGGHFIRWDPEDRPNLWHLYRVTDILRYPEDPNLNYREESVLVEVKDCFTGKTYLTNASNVM